MLRRMVVTTHFATKLFPFLNLNGTTLFPFSTDNDSRNEWTIIGSDNKIQFFLVFRRHLTLNLFLSMVKQFSLAVPFGEDYIAIRSALVGYKLQAMYDKKSNFMIYSKINETMLVDIKESIENTYEKGRLLLRAGFVPLPSAPNSSDWEFHISLFDIKIFALIKFNSIKFKIIGKGELADLIASNSDFLKASKSIGSIIELIITIKKMSKREAIRFLRDAETYH